MRSSYPTGYLDKTVVSMDKGTDSRHIADLEGLPLTSSKAVFLCFLNKYFLAYSPAFSKNSKN